MERLFIEVNLISAMNNYDEELEDILNRVLHGHSIKWTNKDDKIFIIRRVA